MTPPSYRGLCLNKLNLQYYSSTQVYAFMAKWLFRRWFFKIFLYFFLCKRRCTVYGLTGECQTKYPEKFARAFCSDELYKNLIKKKHKIANQNDTVLNIRYFSIVKLFDSCWIKSAFPTVIFCRLKWCYPIRTWNLLSSFAEVCRLNIMNFKYM